MGKKSVGRVERFKTSLAKQKQKLSRQSQIQNSFDKTKVDKDLKIKEEEDKSTKALIFGALRKLSGGSRKSSKESKEKKREATPPKTPPASPAVARDADLIPSSTQAVIPQQCQEETSRRTPVPSDSPLFKKI